MLGDCANYKLDDFIADDSFKGWILGTQPSEFWDNYLAQYPRQQSVIANARELILSLRVSQENYEEDQVIEQIWDNVLIGIDKKPRIVVFRVVFLKVAAAVAILVLCWIGYQVRGKNERGFGWRESIAGLSNMTEESNTSGKLKDVRLADGSIITLDNNSILRYDKDFNIHSRTVYLQGKAFFDITKNAEKPFIIYSNGLVTKVLGTSFSIEAKKDDKDVSVSVVTGKVAVVSQDDFQSLPEKLSSQLSGLVLLPNEKAIFYRKDAHLAKTLVENPVLVNKNLVAEDFVFENIPVNTVFDVLSKAYGINLVYDSSTFENCSLIVDLREESLFEKLGVICKTLNATYRVMGSEILIEGKGCKL